MKYLFWIIIFILIFQNWKTLAIALAIFATLYVIFNKNKKTDVFPPSSPPQVEELEESPVFDDRYQNILIRRPQFHDFVDSDYYNAFDDSYHTPEGFKLRELLLLVWWGKSQKGKALDVRIPKYYYDRYRLNPNEVTKKFFADGLLEYDEVNNLVRPTILGKEIQQKYFSLWEIHSLKEYHANLDKEFTNWNLEKFLVSRHKQQIEYLRASSQFYDELANFLRKNYPREEQDILYYEDEKRADLAKIAKLTRMIEDIEK